MDAANMLKPALARGDLHVIGATTLDEYRKSIEADTGDDGDDPAVDREGRSVAGEADSLAPQATGHPESVDAGRADAASGSLGAAAEGIAGTVGTGSPEGGGTLPPGA